MSDDPLTEAELTRLEESLSLAARSTLMRRALAELRQLRAENDDLQQRLEGFRAMARKYVPAFKVQGIQITETGVSSEDHVRRLRD